MNRERIIAAIASLEKHAVSTDEQHLIAYLKINLGNLFELEDDHFYGFKEITPARKELEFLAKNLDNNQGGGGLEIKVPGFTGNPECPDEAQIFLEYYEEKLRVHVWNGDPDPVTTELLPLEPKGPCPECVARQLLIDKDTEEIESDDELSQDEIDRYDEEINELEEEIKNCNCGG